MKTRHFNFESLLEKTLLGNQQAHILLVMHIKQHEVTQQEIDSMVAHLDADIAKTDHDCNSEAITLRGFLFCINKDYKQAIILFNRAIALGNLFAINNRAFMHQYGLGGPIDFSTAIELYDKAVSLRNVTAMSNRASMHVNGQGGSIDYLAAIRLYDQTIALGNPAAMCHRASMHLNGEGGPIDYAAAIRLYEQAIILGSSTAIYNRAIMHAKGLGGPIDYAAAIRLYDQAIALGNNHAMHNRAYMHAMGQGAPVDYSAAIRLYEQSLNLGNSFAMNNRAFMHQFGMGGPIDYPAAIRLYEQAIRLQNITAMRHRAFMHQFGLGGPINYAATIQLYERAIALGDVIAMNSRAAMHENGLGGSVDCPAAARLYRRAQNNKALLAILNKSYDYRARYHIYMSQKKPGILPEEIKAMFAYYPEKMTEFFCYDDLLNQQDKQEITDFIGEHYLNAARKELNTFSIDNVGDGNLLLQLLDKVPEESSSTKEACILKADYLFALVSENRINSEDLPVTLLAIHELHQKILTKDCQQLEMHYLSLEAELPSIKTFSTDSKQQVLHTIESLINKSNNIMACKHAISSIKIDKEMYWPGHHLDLEKDLLTYISRRQLIDHYAKSLQCYLQAIKLEIDQYQLDKSKSTFWNKSLSFNLRQIKEALKSPLLTSTEIKTIKLIQLTAEVCEKLKTGSFQPSHKNNAKFCIKALEQLPLFMLAQNDVTPISKARHCKH